MTTATGSFSPADLEQIVRDRRDLHAHPETAFEEHRTSGLVAERLRALKLGVKTGVGKTGVLATIEGGKPGKTVLLRADMDALPIQEENEVPYRSTVPGKMHACGHDCHTSVLLGISKVLAREASSMAGAVKLCFQPAEERGGGADAMIADGALESPRPDAAFGIHMWQELAVGKVAVTPGPIMAAVDEFTVTIKGTGTHAAAPHLGMDPIVCLAHVVTALQTLVSRNAPPLEELVVSVTQINAGSAFNIVPSTATMNGTVRIFDPELYEQMPGRFERVVRGVAQGLGCEAQIDYLRHHRPTVNDPAMTRIARAVAAEVVGEANVVEGERTMGGEDFSSFLHQVPGCFIFVGSRNVERGLTFGHHHPRFDVDERCLEIGAEVLLRTARRFLES